MPSEGCEPSQAWTEEDLSALSGLTPGCLNHILKDFQPRTGWTTPPLNAAELQRWVADDAEPETRGACSNFEALRRKWGLFSYESLRDHVRRAGATEQIIAGLIPSRSVSVLVGRSGLGKSPLMYQAAICVASGLPFLGRRTRRGPVLLVDLENGLDAAQEMLEQISRYVGLPKPPSEPDLVLFSLFGAPPHFGQEGRTVMDLMCELRPQLAIVDSLSSFDPGVETKNERATRLLSDCRKLLAGQRSTSVLFVHHLRKESTRPEDSIGPLEDANLSQWFQQVRGASALVNAADARLAIAEVYGRAVEKSNVALVLRGFTRVRGEVAPLYLTRDFDDDQQPLGYRCLVGPELFFNEDRESAYRELPQKFTFAEAKRAYKRADQATLDWIQRGVALGVFKKTGKGRYEKLCPVGEGGT